jgi:O-antigen ligase
VREQRIVVGKIIMVMIVTVATFAALFPEPFAARLSLSNRLEIKSSAERTASLSQSWQLIKKYPLTGVGIGNYGLAVHRELDNAKPAWYYQPAHNVFLLIWSELGVIGLLVVGLLVCWLFFSVIPAAFSPRESEEGIQWFYLLPILTLSLFDHYLWSLYPGMMIGAVWLALVKEHFCHCERNEV